MMKSIDLSALPETAQQEVYDFFLFVTQRIQEQGAVSNAGDCAQLSENSLAADWNTSQEDRAWQKFQ